MGKIITSHRVYAAWDYEKEVEDLNQFSRDGLQLIKGGCFHSEFEEDDSVVYRYQLDFDQHIDNIMRYKEAFAEQGWEYINSTFNGWHYFRKPFDETLPEEEYEIYTDRPSKAEMAGRWKRFAMPLTIVIAIMAVINLVLLVMYPEISRIGMTVEMIMLAAMLFDGTRGMRKIQKGISSEKKFNFPLFFAVILIGYLWFVAFSTMKPSLSADMQTQVNADTQAWSNGISVRIPDYYYLDLDAEGDVSMDVQIVSEDGDVVFEQSGTEIFTDDQRVLLKRGEYQIIVNYDKNNLGDGDKNVTISYDLN